MKTVQEQHEEWMESLFGENYLRLDFMAEDETDDFYYFMFEDEKNNTWYDLRVYPGAQYEFDEIDAYKAEAIILSTIYDGKEPERYETKVDGGYYDIEAHYHNGVVVGFSHICYSDTDFWGGWNTQAKISKERRMEMYKNSPAYKYPLLYNAKWKWNNFITKMINKLRMRM